MAEIFISESSKHPCLIETPVAALKQQTHCPVGGKEMHTFVH